MKTKTGGGTDATEIQCDVPRWKCTKCAFVLYPLRRSCHTRTAWCHSRVAVGTNLKGRRARLIESGESPSDFLKYVGIANYSA